MDYEENMMHNCVQNLFPIKMAIMQNTYGSECESLSVLSDSLQPHGLYSP